MLVSSTSMQAASDATTAMSHGLNLGTQSDAGLGRSVIVVKMIPAESVNYESPFFDMIQIIQNGRRKLAADLLIRDDPFETKRTQRIQVAEAVSGAPAQ